MATTKVGNWFRGAFAGMKPPKMDVQAPTAGQLYSGPQAWSGYRPEAANAQGDAASLQAARGALGQLQGVADQGVTAQGRQQMAAHLRQAQQASSGSRQAALQGASARGTSTGGAGLAAGLSGSAADANAAADAAAALTAQGEQNRIGAMNSVGSLGMGLDQQTYAQEAGRGSAADAFNQWASEQQAGALQQGYQNEMADYEARKQAARERAGFFARALRGVGDYFSGGNS